jgi:Domain of unknown function (DUF4105)
VIQERTKKMPAILITILLGLLTLWATSALYVDVRSPSLRIPAAIVYLLAVAASYFVLRPFWPRVVGCFVLLAGVLVWWLSIKPSNDRIWQADVARTAWAEVNGDTVTIHNYRDCDYRAEFDYSCRWIDKPMNLSDIRGIDVFIVYWGSDWIAHPITSFQIGDHDHIAFSIETRKEQDERYSAIRGFFRSYELIYTAAPETDLVRLRTNFRKGAHGQGEDVYIYRSTAGPDWSRLLFLAYVHRLNELHQRAEWYNVVTSNCTTNIFSEREAVDTFNQVPATPIKKLLNRFDWRILLNGKGDKMEYQRGDFVTGGLPFEDLRRQAYINSAARETQDAVGYSERIRQHRAGF